MLKQQTLSLHRPMLLNNQNPWIKGIDAIAKVMSMILLGVGVFLLLIFGLEETFPQLTIVIVVVYIIFRLMHWLNFALIALIAWRFWRTRAKPRR